MISGGRRSNKGKEKEKEEEVMFTIPEEMPQQPICLPMITMGGMPSFLTQPSSLFLGGFNPPYPPYLSQPIPSFPPSTTFPLPSYQSSITQPSTTSPIPSFPTTTSTSLLCVFHPKMQQRSPLHWCLLSWWPSLYYTARYVVQGTIF